MKATKDELLAKIKPLQVQLNRIEGAERRAANEPLVGRCFKYRNSYSCPEKPSDYWPLYMRVDRADDTGIWCTEFQIDLYGRAEAQKGKHYYRLMDDFQEISGAQFARAWDTFKAKVARMMD